MVDAPSTLLECSQCAILQALFSCVFLRWMQVSGSRQMHAQENEAHFGGVRRKDADFGDADFGDVRQKDANLQSLSQTLP